MTARSYILDGSRTFWTYASLKTACLSKKKKIYKLHVTMVVTYNVPYSPYKAASAVIFTEIKKERTVGEHDAARIPDKLTIVWKHQ
jgi:hypothetical protein